MQITKSLSQILKKFVIILHPKNILISIVKLYKLCISPYLPNSCKYYPSCSEYAIDALKHKGFLKGSLYTVWRLLRCNPFSSGGYDPIIKIDNISVDDKDNCCFEQDHSLNSNYGLK